MRFLVGIDGSDASRKALDHALDVADGTEATLTLAYAVDPGVYAEGGEVPPADLTDFDDRLVIENEDDAFERGRQVVEAAADHARGRAADGVDVDTALLDGDPVEALADFAAEQGYDGVFVGHRGLSAHEERLLGSVAKSLVEGSSVPVTVVH
ncbi:universal stress protein [Halobium salinum]|uniref:Universal stress protein n=1 Tax=Halobium salinum TaxID=1364940 RepID=A0ABD5PFV3_9EURY|nr:universal stress protein [Halobium salinum]